MTEVHKKAVLGFWDGLPQVQGDLKVLSKVLSSLESRVPRAFRDAVKEDLTHLVTRPGKAIRPVLLLQSARFGALEDRHYTLAAGVEALHLATLVHDDIVDASPLRRGQSSFHARRGLAQGVLYGDLLFSLCFDLVNDSCSRENARNLAKMVTFMAGAEIIQDQDRYLLPTSRRRILKRMTGKTGALFALSLSSGASEAGASPQTVSLLRRIGYRLGLIFQLQDDLLDFGPASLAGKQTRSDLAQGHFTLPVAFALEKDPGLGRLLPTLRDDPQKADRIYELISGSGALEDSKILLDLWTSEMDALVNRLPSPNTENNLSQVLNRILGRKL